jgi:hypothetical protein
MSFCREDMFEVNAYQPCQQSLNLIFDFLITTGNAHGQAWCLSTMLSCRLWHSMSANASRLLIYQGTKRAIALNNISTTDRFWSFATAYAHTKNTIIQAPLIAAYSTVASGKTLKLSEELAQGSRYALAKSITLGNFNVC